MRAAEVIEPVEVPAWAATQLNAEQRVIALNRMFDLGITKRYIGDLCGVERPTVHNWSKNGIPSRKNGHHLEMFDRFTGLLRHMSVDLQLTDEQLMDFLSNERTSYDHQDDDMEHRWQWRNAPLIRTSLGGNPKYHSGNYNTIEDRLKKRFPDNYNRNVHKLGTLVLTVTADEKMFVNTRIWD